MFISNGDISVHKGKCQRGLWALRSHCIIHQHDCVNECAQEYFQKPLMVTTINHDICRCHLKLYHAKMKPYLNMVHGPFQSRKAFYGQMSLNLAFLLVNLPACFQSSN